MYKNPRKHYNLFWYRLHLASNRLRSLSLAIELVTAALAPSIAIGNPTQVLIDLDKNISVLEGQEQQIGKERQQLQEQANFALGESTKQNHKLTEQIDSLSHQKDQVFELREEVARQLAGVLGMLKTLFCFAKLWWFEISFAVLLARM